MNLNERLSEFKLFVKFSRGCSSVLTTRGFRYELKFIDRQKYLSTDVRQISNDCYTSKPSQLIIHDFVIQWNLLNRLVSILTVCYKRKSTFSPRNTTKFARKLPNLDTNPTHISLKHTFCNLCCVIVVDVLILQSANTHT